MISEKLISMNCQKSTIDSLKNFEVPSQDEPKVRKMQAQAYGGIRVGSRLFKDYLPAVQNHTYLLRSISYRAYDTTVAFKIVGQDEDGSIYLLWKEHHRGPMLGCSR